MLSIDGITITAGGPGLTVHGTPVNPEPGEFVLVGTSTVNIDSFLPTTTASEIIPPVPNSQWKLDPPSYVKLGFTAGVNLLIISWLITIARAWRLHGADNYCTKMGMGLKH